MTKRKQGKIYDKWHRRVEGQIRHTIGRHPEWFRFSNGKTKTDCINSLAKRIVGEIVADYRLAPITDDLGSRLSHPSENSNAYEVLLSKHGDDFCCSHAWKLLSDAEMQELDDDWEKTSPGDRLNYYNTMARRAAGVRDFSQEILELANYYAALK